MTVKIALVGAVGRMGVEILQACAGRDDIVVAFAVEHRDSTLLGRDSGEIARTGASGVLVKADLNEAVAAADVVVDLSFPDAAADILSAAVKHNKPLVCGTTGLADDVRALFKEAGAKIAVMYTPNLSPGIAVVRDLVRRASAVLAPDYDIEIIEMHHREKKDAPSGTAYFLAEAAAQGAGVNPTEAFCYGRKGNTDIRPTGEIGIHTVRGGGVFGDHTVVIAGPNERVEITHKAGTRALFAEGALRAALFLANAEPGNYSMTDVLGLEEKTLS